jgi:TetR/AcrR family transcriptional regulator, regulator of cefoperazone and chloramphenicol sensitivity
MGYLNEIMPGEWLMGTVSAEEKIITAAVECIEKYGIKGTTIRQIAEQAGVNIAAINYYFRSKDVLIERCMQQTLHNAFDWDDLIQLPGDTAAEHCKAIFNDILKGGLNYPGIARSHFYDLLVDGKYTSPLSSALNGFIDNLVTDMKAKGATLPDAELYLACIQITNAVLMFILSPRLYEEKYGLNLQNPEMRKEYVNRLVDRLLK